MLAWLPIRTVINTGCAGALAADFAAGSVVVPRFLLDASNERHDADEDCVNHLRAAARRAGLTSNHGPILTSPIVLATGAEKRGAYERLGTTAVEMEGTAVATVVREHGSRFGSARVILDVSDLDLPAGKTWKLVLRSLAAPDPPAGVVRSLANTVKVAQTSLEGLFRHFLDGAVGN